ncbi:hypothetical protein GCM10022286_20420 [Gryllotalpicola daejeonensis]|uniref:Citrate transporter-like domain-containing protein n=1 Tax=Gryllotalpicola daejeonensis TaxID=993087 RepID=A0ABP7ZKS1_9MICO
MTPHIVITLATIVLAMVLFVWNRWPPVIVAVAAALVLYLTGVLSMPETLSGFGEPVVILLVALFSIAIALEKTGVAAWAGALLLRRTGGHPLWSLIAIMAVAAVFSGLMGMNGAVVAMVPVVIVIARRTATVPSKLLMPLAFACTAGANLSLLGSPVNVIAAAQIDEADAGPFGFFSWALVGVPQVVGTILLVALLGKRLIPVRESELQPVSSFASDDSDAFAQSAPRAPRLGRDAVVALVLLALLVALLAFNLVPAAIAAAICALLMVVLGVVSVPELVRGVDWTTCVLIGAMIAPAVAMTKTGAAKLIGDEVVRGLGGLGPLAVFGGLFLVTALLSQFISNTSSALVMLPIGVATAGDLGVASLPMILAVALGASTAYITPFSTAVNVAVFGPGGYRFGDFWRLGLVISLWTFAVSVALVPVIWPF